MCEVESKSHKFT